MNFGVTPQRSIGTDGKPLNPEAKHELHAQLIGKEPMEHQSINNFFDLSKPQIVPYPQHLDFPKMVYNHAESKPSRIIVKELLDGKEETIHVAPKVVSKVVSSPEELDEALAQGWSVKPPKMHPDAEVKEDFVVKRAGQKVK